MPVERKFTAGSIIYFDHERGDSIFILKSGRVDVRYVQPESGEKIVKTLNLGEFFGLKSAIINHTREEVVEAVTDALCIEFKVAEFETYVSKNVELMKRLLRVLSNQLRNLGIKVNNYLGNNILYPPNIGLFKIGEYYLINKQYKQAIQVFQRYIQQYPETNIVEEARYRISISEEAQKTGFLKDFKPIDQIVETDSSAGMYTTVDSKAPLNNTHSKLGVMEFMDKYYRAESSYNGGQFEDALSFLKEIFNITSLNLNPEMLSKARVLEINTLYQLKKYNECSQQITDFLKVEKNANVIKKILMVLADIYRDMKNPEGEKSILQKVVMMAPIDEVSRNARDRMEKIQ